MATVPCCGWSCAFISDPADDAASLETVKHKDFSLSLRLYSLAAATDGRCERSGRNPVRQPIELSKCLVVAVGPVAPALESTG